MLTVCRHLKMIMTSGFGSFLMVTESTFPNHHRSRLTSCTVLCFSVIFYSLVSCFYFDNFVTFYYAVGVSVNNSNNNNNNSICIAPYSPKIQRC